MTALQTNVMDESSEMRRLSAASLAGGVVPDRVLLAPWGQVESSNGSFVVDDESAAAVIEGFERQGTDLPIDYEHQTLGGAYTSPSGQAPAAGWIKRIASQAGVGLVGEIEWTERAREMLAAKAYRYLSPVAVIRKADRKLMAIHSAALTNKPAIVGMAPIVNRAEVPSSDTELEPMATLRTELALPEDADAETVLVAASERLTALREATQRRRVEERVIEAMRCGKLVEAQREWAEALVAREEALFDAWLRTAPVVVRPGRIAAPAGLDAAAQRNRAAESRARAEFRTNALLGRLTSEEAYLASARREAESRGR
jgi:phage I-like protein